MLHNRNIINMFSGGIGFVFPMALNLFFTPYVINSLGHEAYGLQNLVNTLIGYLMVADMGLDIPITKLISKYLTEDDGNKLKNVIRTTFLIYVCLGLFGGSLLALGNEYFVYSYFKIPMELVPDAIKVFNMAAIGFIASILNMWGKAIFNGLQRYEISNAISILQTLGALLVGVLLIWQGYGLLGFVFAKILFYCLSGGLYSFIIIKKYLSPSFFLRIDPETWIHLKGQIGYGVILRLSGMILGRLDQTFIAAFIGVASVGLYGIPLLIANAISSLLASLTHFTFPKVVELHTSNQEEKLIALFYSSSKFVAVLSSILFLPFIAFGDKFISIWVNPEAGNSLAITSLLICLGIFLNSLTNIILNSFIVGLGQLRVFTIYSFCRGLTLGCVFYIFIKFFGLLGAGMAILLVCFIDLLFLFLCLKKYLNLSRGRFLFDVYLKPVILAGILIIFGYLLRDYIVSWLTFMLGAGSISLTFLVFLVWLNYFSKSELQIANNFFNLCYQKLKQVLHLT